MNIEKSLNFMDSVIDHKMKTSNEITNQISRNNPLYRILVGAVRGIAVIMERCALELCKMKRPFATAEQAKEIWRILVNWAKRKYSIDYWLDCVGGRKNPQDITDEKRKKAVLMLIFWIHTQKPITKKIALNDKKINYTEYKAKALLVLIVSLVSYLELDFFDKIVLDPFIRLDEESFPKFILHMHLITYRLADLIRIHQMTIKEIYFGVSWHQMKYYPRQLTYNLIIDKVEDVDITTGRFIVLVRRRIGSSDSLTPHADEQYKFSSAIETGFPVLEIPKGEFTLEDFNKELKKATEGCECFIVITVKQFLHEVNELPSRVSRDLTTRTGIVFGDRFLEFMGIYGDFTRFIAGEVSDEGEEDEVSEMMMEVGRTLSKIHSCPVRTEFVSFLEEPRRFCVAVTRAKAFIGGDNWEW
ncbi:4782_t:CDS:2 [Funneliformis caledonium]|uniref:4782_t:CDS:1 n=1 Tax=Funneliformis caledonium TaxID=1117310 RepID=A0A9N9F177_9GLOM|nr:4782_t:CDS:2 [Funneliformis caledonium]